MPNELSPETAASGGPGHRFFPARASVARILTPLRSAAACAAVLVFVIGAVATTNASHDSATRVPLQAALQRHVGVLASADFEGRAGAGGRKAGDYLLERFKEAGLEPLFDGSFEQPIFGFGAPQGVSIGRNIGGFLRGSDPKLRDQWIIVSAHYDHLGNHGAFHPGADDNASGVAMMLELARCQTLASGDERPRRSIAFVGYDLEERGLWGSAYFAEHPPFPLDRLALFVTADMIGRSLGGVCDEYVFVMGTEHAPALRPWIEQAGAGLALNAAVVGSDLLLFDRSDYGPFRKRKIPYLFFSTGESPVYHTPDDRPETLDYAKLTEISRMIDRVVSQAAHADEVPSWSARPEHPLKEAVAVRDVLTRLLENGAQLKVKPFQSGLLRSQIHDLDDAIERGAITPFERRRMLLNAQMVLYSIL